ncbi:hypothetical protein HOY82DRAFT_477631 [Tuber indicum]|nr:hypothetical protein HOY82DRAFT_477631 [Tuber indicum]
MCGYAPDAELLWCCDPYDEYVSACSPGPGRLHSNGAAVNRYCWGGTQKCKGNRGGLDQIYCEKGGTTWCCNKKYESCTDVENQINVCVPKSFRNPVADGPVSLASAFRNSTTSLSTKTKTHLYTTPASVTGEAISSGTIRTIPKSMRFGVTTISLEPLVTTSTANEAGATATKSTSSNDTSQAVETPTTDPPKKSLSAGGACGIVLGALFGIAILFEILYLLRERRLKLKAGRNEKVKGQEVIRNRTWSDKETFTGAEVRSYTVTKWDSQLGTKSGGEPGVESAARGPSIWATAVVSEVNELEAEVPVSEMPAGAECLEV